MKKIYLFCSLICLILIFTACSNKAPSDRGDTSPTASYELVGEQILLHSDYFLQIFKDNELTNSYGIFKQVNNGTDLVVNLGPSLNQCGFFEDNCFYVAGINLVKYDLASSNPQEPANKVKILPDTAEVRRVYAFDSDWIYLSAKVWDEGDQNMGDIKEYAVRRDGSEYKVIKYDEIPKYNTSTKQVNH